MAEQLPEELYRPPALYRALIEAPPDAVLTFWDGSTRCALVNAAAERLLGYGRQELLDLGVTDLSAAEDVPEFPAVIERPNGRGGWRGDGTSSARTAPWS